MKYNALSALLLPLFAVFTINLSSQDVNSGLNSPIVSYIHAEINGSEIILSWRDTPGTADTIYEIRRSNTIITAENMIDTQVLVNIAPGIQTYTDRPEEDMPWWYAIISIRNGNYNKLLIPWRNTLGAPVTIQAVTTDYSLTALLHSLIAEVNEDSVILDFTADRPNREITIFRSTTTMDAPDVFDHAVIVGSSIAMYGQMEDSPLPGIIWYYAAVDSELFESSHSQWIDKAAFSEPVSLSYSVKTIPSGSHLRPSPLPLLRNSFPEKKTLSSDAVSLLNTILNSDRGKLWIQGEAEILNIDRGITENRRQNNLKEILEDSFIREDWADAEQKLFDLSASNGLDKALKARILFYIGQCQYFQNNLQSAFLSFLVSSDHYYPESRRWMLLIYGDLIPVS